MVFQSSDAVTILWQEKQRSVPTRNSAPVNLAWEANGIQEDEGTVTTVASTQPTSDVNNEEELIVQSRQSIGAAWEPKDDAGHANAISLVSSSFPDSENDNYA